MNNSKELFHSRFEKRFTAENWTQKKFSEKSGIDQSLVGKYLRKESTPSIENLDKIAAVWGYTAAEFIAPEELPPARVERNELVDEVTKAIEELERIRKRELRLKALEPSAEATDLDPELLRRLREANQAQMDTVRVTLGLPRLPRKPGERKKAE